LEQKTEHEDCFDAGHKIEDQKELFAGENGNFKTLRLRKHVIDAARIRSDVRKGGGRKAIADGVCN